MQEYFFPIRKILFGLSLFFLNACLSANQDSDIQSIKSKTIPSTAKTLNTSPLTQNNFSAKQTWEFEIDWNLESYNQWLNSQLQSDFKLSQQESSHQEWTKILPGDINTLQIKIINFSKPIRIEVSFSSTAY